MGKQALQKPKKTCSKCQKQKASEHFFMSSSPLHTDGRYPVCKDCIKELVDVTNLESVKDVLRMMDRPFLNDLWKISEQDPKDTFGMYMKNLGLKKFKDMTWSDNAIAPNDSQTNRSDEVSTAPKSNFVVTEELKNRWGDGYSPDEIDAFERKYNLLRRSYDEKTAMHSEGLKTYIRYRVKEERATAKNEFKEAKEWGALASKAATDAKLNVNQMTKSDISGGIDVVAQLFEAVESEVGVIPLLPKLIEQPYDDADLIIWATVNYNRRLEDKPFISYKEIWNFYDEMLGEHFKQQGYNEEQIKAFKAKRNNVFRDLSEVYKEPLYENDGEQ